MPSAWQWAGWITVPNEPGAQRTLRRRSRVLVWLVSRHRQTVRRPQASNTRSCIRHRFRWNSNQTFQKIYQRWMRHWKGWFKKRSFNQTAFWRTIWEKFSLKKLGRLKRLKAIAFLSLRGVLMADGHRWHFASGYHPATMSGKTLAAKFKCLTINSSISSRFRRFCNPKACGARPLSVFEWFARENSAIFLKKSRSSATSTHCNVYNVTVFLLETLHSVHCTPCIRRSSYRRRLSVANSLSFWSK